MNDHKQFRNFAEFYPYYLSEHQQPACRALHYIGSLGVLLLLGWIIASQQWSWLWLLLLCGYGCAWLGHFFIEHNKPATFQYPFYSFLADWVMLKDFLTGQLAAKLSDMPPRR